MYVNPSSIFPTTGAIISRDARVSQDFAQVTDYLSDLQSHTTQLSFGVAPVAFNSSFQWNVTYIWQKIVDEERGFAGGNTARRSVPAPVGARRSRRAPPDHVQRRLHVPPGRERHRRSAASSRAIRSRRWSPATSNGDGYNNDRAFIYNPAIDDRHRRSQNGIGNLLTNAPSSVRDCLTKQLGTIAGRNSCEGPWSTTLSLRISLVSQAMKIVPDRATISLGIANPLTGVDALVHGSNNLHGWGAPSFADPTLLYVRGFDPTTQQYHYDVNPRFGANRQAQRGDPRADAAHARRAPRRRSRARATGSLPAPARRPRRPAATS